MRAFREYCDLMEKNRSRDALEDIYFNMRILQELYPERPTLAELKTVDMGQFIRAAHTTHFVMQQVVVDKINALSDTPPEEVQKSKFDDYDREDDLQNGSPDSKEPGEAWRYLKEAVDRIIKIATRVLHTGYSECMGSDIMTLLEYVRFEIDTADENT